MRAKTEELRAFKARALGLPNARLEAWDRHFYAAQLKVGTCVACSIQTAQQRTQMCTSCLQPGAPRASTHVMVVQGACLMAA